jgi:hypothetical protein
MLHSEIDEICYEFEGDIAEAITDKGTQKE